jgi:hypothetical protein
MLRRRRSPWLSRWEFWLCRFRCRARRNSHRSLRRPRFRGFVASRERTHRYQRRGALVTRSGKLCAIGDCLPGVFDLRRNRSQPRITTDGQFLRRGPRFDSAASSVVTDASYRNTRERRLINVVNNGSIYIKLLRDCSRLGLHSNKRRSNHDRGIRNHIGCRRKNRCAAPSSQRARDKRRSGNPTRAASKERQPMAPLPMPQEPSNIHLTMPNSPASRCNCHLDREVECTQEGAVGPPTLRPAAHWCR